MKGVIEIKMNTEPNPPIYPVTMVAWATPLVTHRASNGLIEPVEFMDELPDPPESNSVYTFLDEKETAENSV